MNYEKIWYDLKAKLMKDNKKSIIECMNIMEIAEANDKFKDSKKESIGFTGGK